MAEIALVGTDMELAIDIDASHAEVKSMHTAAAARHQGVGRAMIEHLLSVAAGRNYHRVSLETGTMDGFDAARTLYASMGFQPCEPFGDYTPNEHSTCMTLVLHDDVAGHR